MNYDQMPAGMEMDALIAQKVMGREVAHRGPTGIPEYDPPNGALFFMDTSDLVPRYSTDDLAAIRMLQQKGANEAWCALVDMDFRKTPPFTAHINGCSSTAETYPLAICRATLKAIEQDL